MSTKIFNGYRLPMMTMQEFNQFILRCQAAILENLQETVAKAMANLISSDADELFVFGEEEFIKRNLQEEHMHLEEAKRKYVYSRPIQKAYTEIRNRHFQIQKTGMRDPLVDFDFEVCFIPMEDSILALIYTEQRAFRELWEAQPEVTTYGYWNNSSPEEGISDEEWEERREKWEKALGDNRPMDVGMTIAFSKGVPELYNISEEAIVAAFSSLEKRAAYVAFSKAFDDKYKEFSQSGVETNDLYTYTSKWLRKTPEGKEYLIQVEQECARKLIPELTKEHLQLRFKSLYGQSI